MRTTILMIAALALAACEPSEQEKERVRRELPAGCTVKDLGAYGEARSLMVVVCDGRPTRTNNFTYVTGGKYRSVHLVVQAQIGD